MIYAYFLGSYDFGEQKNHMHRARNIRFDRISKTEREALVAPRGCCLRVLLDSLLYGDMSEGQCQGGSGSFFMPAVLCAVCRRKCGGRWEVGGVVFAAAGEWRRGSALSPPVRAVRSRGWGGGGVTWGRRISLFQEIKSFCLAYLPGIERCAEPSKSGWRHGRRGMWRHDGGGVMILGYFYGVCGAGRVSIGREKGVNGASMG